MRRKGGKGGIGWRMAYRACTVRMQQSCGGKAATRLRGYEATRVGRTRIQGKEGGQETRCEGSGRGVKERAARKQASEQITWRNGGKNSRWGGNKRLVRLGKECKTAWVAKGKVRKCSSKAFRLRKKSKSVQLKDA